MLFNKDMLRLYAITDRECLRGRDIVSQVEQAVLGGATIIQLRDKGLSQSEVIDTAKRLLPVCHSFGVPLIVNDDYTAALESGADGVHVGAEDASVAEIRRIAGEGFIIGATAKTVRQALLAQEQGADYLGVGAVFPSPTKTNAIRITPQQLTEICGSVHIPAVAIGGINRENVHAIKGCGQCGIAVVSAVFATEDVKGAAADMRKAAEEVCS